MYFNIFSVTSQRIHPYAGLVERILCAHNVLFREVRRLKSRLSKLVGEEECYSHPSRISRIPLLFLLSLGLWKTTGIPSGSHVQLLKLKAKPKFSG